MIWLFPWGASSCIQCERFLCCFFSLYNLSRNTGVTLHPHGSFHNYSLWGFIAQFYFMLPLLLISCSNLSYLITWLCILSPNNQLLLKFYSTGISAWSHSNRFESEVFAGWTYTTTLWPNQWWSLSYSLQLSTNASASFSKNCRWLELHCQVTWHLWALSQAPASSSWINALLLS